MIAIVDYDMGNVASVANMLKRVGVEGIVTRDAAVIAKADKIILPGVGAFDKGMRNLADFGLIDPLEQAVLRNSVPVLGICLGMQLLTDCSEEGVEPGLGWIEAKTRRFRFSPDSSLKIPHMGWNYAEPASSNPLLAGGERNRFYFVHGFYVECARPQDVMATATYGLEFACAVRRDNIFGVQFHPEKSHRFGMRLLENFVKL